MFGVTPQENPELAQIKQLFDTHQANCRLINIEEGTLADVDFRDTITQMCGFNQIPAIFIGYKYLGGIEELKAIESRGLLEDLIKDVKIK